MTLTNQTRQAQLTDQPLQAQLVLPQDSNQPHIPQAVRILLMIQVLEHPQLPRPVQQAAPDSTETVNAEALDQCKKAEKDAADALSGAISAMSRSNIPPGKLSTAEFRWKLRIMYLDFIASDDAIQKVSQHIKQIPAALQQAEEAPGKAPRGSSLCSKNKKQSWLQLK